MQIINATTPANFYHAIRRQFHRDFRIPVVFFTPKKLLRYPEAVSRLEDFATGTRFQELIDDPYVKPKEVKRLLVCSGKIYYDLLEQQQKDQRKDVAVVRMEQIYPLPVVQLRELLKKYPPERVEYCWVQEEPRNMGPWNFILRVVTEAKLRVICRKPSPSPASGHYKQHAKEQEAIVQEAFEMIHERELVNK